MSMRPKKLRRFLLLSAAAIALFRAAHSGLDAIGFDADKVTAYKGFGTNCREKLAAGALARQDVAHYTSCYHGRLTCLFETLT